MKLFYKNLLFIFFLFSEFYAVSQNTPAQVAYGNNWVAVDGADRTLPIYAEVGDHKNNRYIGVFYWLWHAYIRTNPIKNMTEELRATNGNPNFAAQDWYWGEPENGYYHNSDPWVIRRHLQMFANAGVDFLYLDYTNGPIGSESFDAFMEVALEMQNQGIPVPKIVFFINDDGGRTALDFVYNTVYKPGKYQSLWFYWEGKPLVMEGIIHASNDEIRNFFTFRDTWAFQESTNDQWRFIDNYPQRPSYHNGIVEQLCVSKGMGAPLFPLGAVNDKGSSYTNQNGPPQYNAVWETPRSPFGDYFEEQWGRVHEIDPPIVCVTGFNEWTAGQWETNDPGMEFMGRPCDEINWFMVDQFNVEFNRDIEPMKGEYTDNYYYQLVNHIRKYKGLAPPQATSPGKTISIGGDFAEWNNVTPIYKDAIGDTQHRNFKNVNNSGMYTNTTGRNDIIESRVTSDENNVYFYTKTANPLTAWNSPNWMFLFIDVDRNKNTGWEGYDYVVNQDVNSATETTIKKWENNSWSQVGICAMFTAGNELEIAVPKSTLGIDSNPNVFFHWADNMQQLDDITQFFINGESAPDRRFNYQYSAASSPSNYQTPYNGAINLPGVIEAENFDNGGEGVAYHDSEAVNYGNEYRPGEGVDIQSCSEGGYNVGWTSAGEWMEYTVNVASSGGYTIDAHVATPNDGAGFHIEINGDNLSGVVAVPNTGDWQNWQIVSSTVNLAAGQHVLRLVIDEGGFNINSLNVIPEGGTGIVSGTVYRLVARNSGKVLDVSACSMANGANIQQWPWLGGNCQLWKVEATDNGYHRLISQQSGQVLDVNECSSSDGANVQQWPWNGGGCQQWKIEPTDNGYYRLIARHSGKVLDVSGCSTSDGASVHQWTWYGGDCQQWKLEAVAEIQSMALSLNNIEKESEIIDAASQVVLYPNPADDQVNIRFSKQYETAVEISVIDMSGRRISCTEVNGTDNINIDTASLEKGIYTIVIQTPEGTFNKKLVINH